MFRTTVYKHITPSNKVYIGITTKSVEQRWDNGNGYSHNKHFNSAIKKYGWENIKHEIIAENLSREQACKLEQELIKKYNSTDSRFGYNVSSGGDVGFNAKMTEEHRKNISKALAGRKLSEENKRKISEANKGRTPPNKGKPMSEEQKLKISEASKLHRHSEETKQKISRALKGKKPWNTGLQVSSMSGKHHTEETKAKISSTEKATKLATKEVEL